MAKLRFTIRRIHADRTQYKPYMFELNPEHGADLLLEVEIPDDLVREEVNEIKDYPDGEVYGREVVKVITPEGLSVLMNRIATPIQQMNDQAMQRRAGR